MSIPNPAIDLVDVCVAQVFGEVAYRAKSKQDLLDGIDEYMDDLTVLPPSIWDPSIRLEPPSTAISMVSTSEIGR